MHIFNQVVDLYLQNSATGIQPVFSILLYPSDFRSQQNPHNHDSILVKAFFPVRSQTFKSLKAQFLHSDDRLFNVYLCFQDLLNSSLSHPPFFLLLSLLESFLLYLLCYPRPEAEDTKYKESNKY